MKVAVTGPAGFVGMDLIRLLTSREHEVIAIDRRSFDTGMTPKGTAIRADILDAPGTSAGRR